jgi:hypothetical protein
MIGPILPGESVAAIRSVPSPVTTTTALPLNAQLWPSAADEFELQDGDFMAAHPELPDGWQPDPEDLAPWWHRDTEPYEF